MNDKELDIFISRYEDIKEDFHKVIDFYCEEGYNKGINRDIFVYTLFRVLIEEAQVAELTLENLQNGLKEFWEQR